MYREIRLKCCKITTMYYGTFECTVLTAWNGKELKDIKHTHTTLCGILTRNMKFTCLNSAVSNHLH